MLVVSGTMQFKPGRRADVMAAMTTAEKIKRTDHDIG